MKILSIQIGLPKSITYKGNQVETGIFKDPVSGPLMLKKLNLEGDKQADLTVHGGVDKALYAYGADAYPLWKETRPADDFPFGAMGENLSMDELDETKLCIGDTFKLGESVVQVAQPRYPCLKLAAKFNDPTILKQFMELGRPGVYFRVLQEGMINVGDQLQLISREPFLLSIADIFDFSQEAPFEKDHIANLLTLKSLTPNLRKKLETWLQIPE